MPERNNTITYEIVEYIGTISSWESGWNRELNLISWNGAKPKYDIREWDEKHDRMSKGITLHPWEMRNLVDLYLTNNSEKAVEAGRMREAERRERRAEHRRTGGGAGEPGGQMKEVRQAPPFEAETGSESLRSIREVRELRASGEQLREEDRAEAAQMVLDAPHTPSHTPESETEQDAPDGQPLMETEAPAKPEERDF